MTNPACVCHLTFNLAGIPESSMKSGMNHVHDSSRKKHLATVERQ